LPPAAFEQPLERVRFRLYFRHVARLYCATFFTTMLCAGIATFTSTHYDQGTDKIIMFYGMFNPCIWFDHYPAKAIAMTGMGFFIIIGVLWSMMLFVHEYTKERVFRMMWCAAVLSTVTFCDMAFVNVFTTNLYPDEALRDGPSRRLHGVHFGADGAVSLMEESMSMSQADVRVIILHTSFYIVWLLAQLLLASFVMGTQKHIVRSWGQGKRLRYHILMAVGFFGMVVHAAAMLVIIVQNKPKVDWYKKNTLASSIQNFVVFVDMWTYASAWGWVPVMLFRILTPVDEGICFTFRLADTVADDGFVSPHLWVGRCLQLVALVLACGAVFQKELDSQSPQQSKYLLRYAITSKPFAYIAAPAYLGSSILMLVGITLTVVQRRLVMRRNPHCLMLNGVVAFFSLYGCLLSILDEENFCWMFFIASCVSMIVWIFQLNHKSPLNAVSFTLVGVAVLLCVNSLTAWWWYYAFLLYMASYPLCVPEGPHVYVTLERTEEYDYDVARSASPVTSPSAKLQYEVMCPPPGKAIHP